MASSRQIRWLSEELSALAGQGVIEPDVPERVRAHFASTPRRAEFPVLGVLGAALVGFGVLLLLAHNWSEFAPPARGGICLGALLGTQGLAAWTLLRRAGSAGWSETAGLLWVLAVVGARALIDQTYQVATPLDDFLWSCAWLSLPVVFLLQARGAAVLLLSAATFLLFADLFDERAPHRFWLLAAGVASFAAWLFARRDPRRPSLRDAFLGWVLVSVLLLGAGCNFGVGHGAAWMLVFATALAGAHAFGRSRLEVGEVSFLAAPAAHLGALGTGVLVVAFSVGEWWGIMDADLDVALTPASALPSVALAGAGAALAVRGALSWWRASDWPRLLAAVLPVAIALAWGIGLAVESPGVAASCLALYGLALGSGSVRGGMREGSARRANGGLVLVGGVVLARFFDTDWSFVVRGLAFIVIGVAFLILNLWLLRRRPEASR